MNLTPCLRLLDVSLMSMKRFYRNNRYLLLNDRDLMIGDYECGSFVMTVGSLGSGSPFQVSASFSINKENATSLQGLLWGWGCN